MTTLQDATPAPGATSEPPAQEWRRAARLWAVVVCFIAVGVARSAQVDIPFRDPNGAFLLTRVVLTAWIFLGLVALDGLLRSGRPFAVRRVLSTIRARWTPGRLALA